MTDFAKLGQAAGNHPHDDRSSVRAMRERLEAAALPGDAAQAMHHTVNIHRCRRCGFQSEETSPRLSNDERFQLEEFELLHRYFDREGIPRDVDGKPLSLVGRVKVHYLKGKP
jgi:hypothetical protein